MKRGSYALVLGLAVCSVAFAETGTFSYFSPAVSSSDAEPRRYTTEQEWLVSEIAGSIWNIAAFAGHFEPGDPFQVRNKPASGTPRFKLTRGAEEYTVAVGNHVWMPDSYLPLARSLMADGAGAYVSEDAAQDAFDLVGALAHPTPEIVQAQTTRLSRLLHDHPRSAAFHERAALLIGAMAQRETAPQADRRVLLCRMTAHLAVARALHQGLLSSDGRVAERTLLALAARERGVTHTGAYPDVAQSTPALFGER